MADWTAPSGLSGDGSRITVSLSMLGGGDYSCPMRNALKARRLYPSESRPREILEDFTDAFIMDELDRRAARDPNQWKPSRPRGVTHEGVRVWAEHALARYEEAFPVEADAIPLTEAARPWFLEKKLSRPDHRGVKVYRLTLWGRCLQSADGTYREFRWPSHRVGNERRRPRSALEQAVAAFITASSSPGPRPQRVRVIEFGFLDGRPDSMPLFDGTREQALALYEKDAKEALSAIADGDTYNPGRGCTSCPFTSVCPAVRRADGLLRVDTRDLPLRTWSPTSARSYRECPARTYLRGINLPVDNSIERNAASERGRAVHGYLAKRHKAEPPAPCDLAIPEDWLDDYELEDSQRGLGADLLRFHAEVCPMVYVRSPADVRAEPLFVYKDRNASSRVIVQPDLLYRDGESWVWREVKTASRRRRFRDVVEHYPQLALGIELLARGELGGSRARSRVELELLHPEGAELITLDPFTPEIRQAAQKVLQQMVGPWRADNLFTASPGPHCTSCEVARWCPSRAADAGADGGAR